MKRKHFFLLLVLGVLPLSGGISAQDSSLRLVPRVGLLSPDSYLYEYFENFAGDGPMDWSSGSLGRALVVGLGVERAFKDGDVVVRGELSGAFEGWMSVSHSVLVPRDLFEPPYVATTWTDVPYSVAMAGLQVLLPLRFELGRFEPYVLAGVGGKYYDFRNPLATAGETVVYPSNGFTWGGDLGVGVTVPFLGVTWDLQGRDALNSYWGKIQSDFLFTAGVVIPLG